MGTALKVVKGEVVEGELVINGMVCNEAVNPRCLELVTAIVSSAREFISLGQYLEDMRQEWPTWTPEERGGFTGPS